VEVDAQPEHDVDDVDEVEVEAVEVCGNRQTVVSPHEREG